ncbi:hypothetical protein WG628_09735 [Stenotrophomonas maltophilia]|nr:hypothetical protein [Stenotrophomonas maltophilia]
MSVNITPPVADAAIIRVSFDIDQVSSDLLWQAAVAKTHRDLYSPVGRYAGAVHFREGDTVSVEVTGYGRSGTLLSTNILDAMLYTVPHTSGERFSAPSPFSSVRATTPIEQWQPARIEHDREPGFSASVQRSLTPLTVVQDDGRWKLSLILTVVIERLTKAGPQQEIRVFSFDPEAEVGSGTEPPV